MGFLSNLKRKKNKTNAAQLVKNNSNDTPPSMGPIDPDGSTASHSSNEIYVTNPQQSAAMTASQFQNTSDEVNKKRLSQPKGSKYTQSNTSSLNIRSTQGKNCNTKSRDGVPIITSDGADYFSPSAVSTKKNYAVDGFYSKSKQMFGGKERPKTRPSARTSAFGGAPRYDWMDIETTAAIKIQAVYRRIQTLNYLDANGLSTPGMRNRRAQRKARYQTRMAKHATSADVPFPFNMCGVGLLFGDGTFEDEKIVEDIEKKKERMGGKKKGSRRKKKKRSNGDDDSSSSLSD